MKLAAKFAVVASSMLALMAFEPAQTRAQSPVSVAPVVVDTAVPIIVNAIKPKPKNTGLAKFEGYVMNANIAQITVRAKGNDLSILTFPLSPEVSQRMQKIVDKGGYQYGDKVTIYYDPATQKAMKLKGKPSKPI
ncbi:MAG TPA: hypothetical protein VJN93_08945 [Candidatus Acidoferrum sp.]|nr:hypothetical protein [Candidatus Acidoferrum sp.]